VRRSVIGVVFGLVVLMEVFALSLDSVV